MSCMYVSIALIGVLLSNGGQYRASVLYSENSINNDILKNNGNSCICAIYRTYATNCIKGEDMCLSGNKLGKDEKH